MSCVYTVGHSNHPIEKLLGLLREHSISAVADVRSAPYSRMNPQFNRESLHLALSSEKIAYVFLGTELGARTKDRTCYRDGRVQYDLLAKTGLFRRGLERVRQGSQSFRLALLCAEKDPIYCHRMLLISRHLAEQGLGIEHILENGALESQGKAVERLLRRLRITEADMFRPREEIIAEGFRIQAEAVAYREDGSGLRD